MPMSIVLLGRPPGSMPRGRRIHRRLEMSLRERQNGSFSSREDPSGSLRGLVPAFSVARGREPIWDRRRAMGREIKVR